MKTKKFNKKLTLNKNTIVNLDDGDMQNAKGGSGFTCIYDYMCNSYNDCGETQDISGCPEWTVFCPPTAY